MKKIPKNYRLTLILLISIIIGTVLGIVLGEQAKVLSPLGDLFLNMLLIVIIPLIFLTISTSIAKMKEPKRLGNIMISIIGVFIFTSLIAVVIGLVSTYNINLVEAKDSQQIKQTLTLNQEEVVDNQDLNLLERTVQAVSANDFVKLLSKDNMIALIVFSILFGLAMWKVKEKAEPLLTILLSANEVIFQFVNLIMYYAPVGLCCYFAALVGELGSTIAIGYFKTFVLYTIIAIGYYAIVYTIYAYCSAGMRGVKMFWMNILPPTLTSLATCSSAACIPINVEAAKKIGVSDDIAETIIPMGTSFHKDGSIIGSVFKIMFLVCLFGTDVSGVAGIGKVLFIALIANLLVTAVPIGGGTISETLIITMMGYPLGALPILTMIAAIIDAPATMLNVVGDTSASMLTARIVDGKNWHIFKKITLK